jgi:hypothetical protein
MKTLFLIVTALTSLTVCSVGSNAKVFQHWPENNELRNADSFSVECRNNRTGTIDRETVDVDAATVTIEISGSEPIVHHITGFALGVHQVQDRFGQPRWEFFVRAADWGRIGASVVGLVLTDERWYSHHEDGTWWKCANY